MEEVPVYEPDRSLRGKLRRRLVRLFHRRPARVKLDRPMVSFTFDDALSSAARDGARLLEEAGARGTYFIAAGLCGRTGAMGEYATGDDVGRLAAAGHEIGCHTATHLDCGQAGSEEAEVDVARNVVRLSSWGAAAPSSFAFPFGDVNADTKQALGARFQLLRALHHGVVEEGTDLAQCPAVGIEGRLGYATAWRWLDVAERRSAWLIFYTHDVRREPSRWGCAPADLQRLVREAVARGFELVTVAEGARKMGTACPPSSSPARSIG